MELKFTNAERKSINNGNISEGAALKIGSKLPGFAGGAMPPVTANGIKPTMFAQTNPSSTILGNLKQINRSLAYKLPLIKNTTSTNSLTGGNTGPSQSDSSASAIHPGFAIGAWLGGGVLEGLGQIKSADEHLADAGTSTANINGISYTQLNSVNANLIIDDYTLSTATDFLTNPGRGLAKLFGSSKAKREARLAELKSFMLQGAARDEAYTKYLRLDNAKKYGNTEDQVLYAKDGKLPKYSDGLSSVSTGLGLAIAKPNAKVSSGEVIATALPDGSYSMYRVPGMKNNKDGKLALLGPNDYVFSNKNGASDIAWNTGDIEGTAAYMEAVGHPKRYACGKLPKLEEGWLGNFIPSALGSLASLDLILMASRNKPYRPNTYAANPYELEGLTTLAGLRVNPYPIINQLRSAEARTNRAIDIAGGLSGSQRTAARLANLNTTLNNIANLLSNIQQQNNAYKTTYAQAAINAGQASRQARMQANQWDLDMYSKAHAARNRGIQTGIANMLAQIQQYQANEFKRRQFNDTMGLYRDDMKQRLENMNWYQNNALNVSKNPDPIKNPGSQYFNQLSPLEKYMMLYNRGIIS